MNKGENGFEKKVTISDVAREANTSIGTVYRAIYNNGRVSKATREKVLETVERLGYKPNTIARGFALRNKFKILVIMPQEPKLFWNDVRKGAKSAADELSEFGIQVITFYHNNGVCQGQTIMEVLTEQKVDAISMSIINFNDCGKVLMYASDNNIPVAVFNEEPVSRERLFYYGPDNEKSGRIAAELMYKFSASGIKCCTIQESKNTSLSRQKGFMDQLMKYGEQINYIGSFRCVAGEADIMARQILNDFPDIGGIYFPDYLHLTNSYKLFEGYNKKITIIGHEFNEELKEALKNNTISALLVQEKVCQGYYPLKMLYSYLVTGQKPERDIYYSNINIILASNYDYLQHSSYGCGYE